MNALLYLGLSISAGVAISIVLFITSKKQVDPDCENY